MGDHLTLKLFTSNGSRWILSGPPPIPCTFCGAKAGEHCRTMSYSDEFTRTHAKRDRRTREIVNSIRKGLIF